MKATTLHTSVDPKIVEAVADLVMEIASDMGIEDEVEGYELLVQSQGLVCHNPLFMRFSLPYTEAFKRFVKMCVHEVVHVRRTVQGERLAPPGGLSWTHPEECETEREARERVVRLSRPTNLAILKLASMLWARRRRQEEFLVDYMAKGS